MSETPELIQGGLGVDDRGAVAFCNEYDFEGVKRFYMVSNHRQGFVRAWHAHKNESKAVTVVQGAAIIAAVKVDDWDEPSKDAEVHRYVLSADKPAVLKIPAGFANGFKTLSADTKVVFYSSSTLDESKGDDFRYPAQYWDPWHVEER